MAAEPEHQQPKHLATTPLTNPRRPIKKRNGVGDLQSGYEVWGDNLIEIKWFMALHPSLSGSRSAIISARGSNPVAIENLIQYDRPDIILLKNGSPVLVMEKTREVPTGHNVGQRMARLVRAVESSIPVIKFFPFDAMKHGRFAGMCHMNARILAVFSAMARIHRVPVLAINWPKDSDGELTVDGSEDDELREVVGNFIESQCTTTWPAAKKVSESMEENYRIRVRQRPAYGKLPPSVKVVPTSMLPKYTRLSYSEFAKCSGLQRVKSSVVYNIGMTEDNCRREDPFTGSQFIYDYLECRSGKSVDEKTKNLILWFPYLTKRRFMEANPNDPSRKSCNWYLTANAMVFSDEVVVLRENK